MEPYLLKTPSGLSNVVEAMKQIESIGNSSAAFVLCHLRREVPVQEPHSHFIGGRSNTSAVFSLGSLSSISYDVLWTHFVQYFLSIAEPLVSAILKQLVSITRQLIEEEAVLEFAAKKDWLEKLKEVSFDMDDMLDEGHSAQVPGRSKTTSFVDVPKIQTSCSVRGHGKGGLGIIPIVGMGGINIARAIIEALDYKVELSIELETCLQRVRQYAEGKKFLLVLDIQLAFLENEEELEHLEQIGRKIVRKCKSLTLVSKILGNLMCFKKTIRQWEDMGN
ncbi:hypothetical protein FEM48_Zijuj01G0316100 [Ziziphus jujuba var. spinosa]|uniref:Uncharacterized protein n=1 Tax=Ziziphus jujuba var. spinosa TaxID=714518 RepID=A0A978W6B1_ZIZJJ|nr:hypothetical protein FEM48_Zijuj01G0316100 [Ziziphus jujuba var. spinosa]